MKTILKGLMSILGKVKGFSLAGFALGKIRENILKPSKGNPRMSFDLTILKTMSGLDSRKGVVDKTKGTALDNNKPTRSKACALTKQEGSKTPSVSTMLEVIQDKIGDKTLSFGVVMNLLDKAGNDVYDLLETDDFGCTLLTLEGSIIQYWVDYETSLDKQSYQIIEYIFNLVNTPCEASV